MGIFLPSCSSCPSTAISGRRHFKHCDVKSFNYCEACLEFSCSYARSCVDSGGCAHADGSFTGLQGSLFLDQACQRLGLRLERTVTPLRSLVDLLEDAFELGTEVAASLSSRLVGRATSIYFPIFRTGSPHNHTVRRGEV